MSVYRTPKSRFFQYDFVITGRRFHGSTGQETRRAAEATERRLRIEAAEGRLDESAQLTLGKAAGKWWGEVGKFRGDALDVERRIEALLGLVGPDKRIVDITTPVISEAIQRRRGQTYTRSPKDGAKKYLPSDSTVNRDVVDTLRPILKRALTHWGARGMPAIDWKSLRLDEPREIVRTYSAEEQATWLAENGAEARLALDILLTYGLRFGEMFFPLDAFEPEGPRLVMFKGRKRDVPHTIPLREDHAREIAARVGRARAAGLDTIWFQPGPKNTIIPIPYYGLEARISSAADRAGVKPGRRIHGARHHAGTAILRKTNNLGMARRLLGHLNIQSTMRYAHTLEDDLRSALDAEPSRNSPGDDAEENSNPNADKASRA